MSTPANRLASYRSYSYYHILAICYCTHTASALSVSTSPNKWKHATTGTLGPYSPQPVSSTDAGNYCVLINGATDAAFTISTVNWSSTTAGGATPGDRYTSVALEGSIDISEPKGIVFLDQIVKCCVALGVDFSNSTFVLKTFFTGFGFEPGVGDFVDTLTDIAPLMFTVTDVTGSFTESGGIYHMEAVSSVDGTARLP